MQKEKKVVESCLDVGLHQMIIVIIQIGKKFEISIITINNSVKDEREKVPM